MTILEFITNALGFHLFFGYDLYYTDITFLRFNYFLFLNVIFYAIYRFFKRKQRRL